MTDRVAKRVIGLALANAIAPVLQLLVSPIISRLYSPSVFGEYSLQYGVAILASMLLGGFLYQGMISEKDRDCVDLLYWEVMFITAASTFFLGAALLTAGAISGVLPGLGLVFSLAVAITLGQIQACFLSRVDRTTSLSLALVIKAVVLVVAQIVLGLRTSNADSLLLSAVLAELVFFLLGSMLAKEGRPRRSSIRSVLQLSITKRHLNYPAKFLPSQILSFVVNLLPLGIMNSLGANQIGGYFAFSLRLTQAPAAALTGSVRSTYWRSIGELDDSGLRVTRSIVSKGHLLLLLAAAIVWFIPDFAYAAIFGPDWAGLSSVLALVLMWSGASVLTQFPSEIVKHSSGQGLILRTEALGAVMKLAASALFIAGIGAELPLTLFCLSCYAFNIIAAKTFLARAENLHGRVPA